MPPGIKGLANAVLLNTAMFVTFGETQKKLPGGTAISLFAGAIAGAAQAFLTTPLDWLKIQAQLRDGSSFCSVVIATLPIDVSFMTTTRT